MVDPEEYPRPGLLLERLLPNGTVCRSELFAHCHSAALGAAEVWLLEAGPFARARHASRALDPAVRAGSGSLPSTGAAAGWL